MANKPQCNLLPLHLAVNLNDSLAVKALLDKKADKSILLNNSTALHTAVCKRVSYTQSNYETVEAKRNFEIIKLLASNKNDVHDCSNNGYCSFDYAIMNCLRDVVDYFVSLGGDLFETKNQHGLSPINFINESNEENSFYSYIKKNYSK